MSIDVISRQVLISGQIIDAISGARPRNRPAVRVSRDADGRSLDHVSIRVMEDGTFAVYGDPLRIIPAQDIDVRIEVSAEGYSDALAVQSYTAAQLAREAQTIEIDGDPVPVEMIAAAPRLQDFAIDPLPVTLKGRISHAEDPATPLVGASIEITAPDPIGPVTTDADGFYTLGPAPVAATVTVRITAAGRTPLTTDIRLNFRNPINQGSFALEPA